MINSVTELYTLYLAFGLPVDFDSDSQDAESTVMGSGTAVSTLDANSVAEKNS